MNHCIATSSVDFLAFKHLPVRFQHAAAICKIALQSYINDIINFVKVELRKELSPILDDDNPNNAAAHLAARSQLTASETWAESDHPLSFKCHSRLQLVRAICSPHQDIAGGLPKGDGKQLPISEFASKLWAMGTSPNPRIVAPLVPSSSFPAILPTLIAEVSAYAPPGDALVKQRFFRQAIEVVINHLDICFIPYLPPTVMGAPGARPTRISYKHWINLRSSACNADRIPVDLLTEAEVQTASIYQALNMDQMDSPSASWSILTSPISTYGDYLLKTCLPEEFSITRISFDTKPAHGYVKETYTWVNSHATMSNSLHRLAIILAALYAKNAPHLSNPLSQSHTITATTSMMTTTSFVKSLPWIPKTTVSAAKGTHEPQSLFVMMAVSIIALLEKTSPLRQDIVQNGSLGAPWTSKHG